MNFDTEELAVDGQTAVTAESAYQVTGDGYAPTGEISKDGRPTVEEPTLTLMGRVCLLCNDAELFQQDGAWKVEGDPTEGALYPFALKLGMDQQAEQAAFPRIDAIPFESEHSSWRPSTSPLTEASDARQRCSGGNPGAVRSPFCWHRFFNLG